MNDLLIIRILFIAALGGAAFFLKPFDMDARLNALFGAAIGAAIVIFEVRIKQVSLKRLIGAAVGSVLGILGAYLISLVLGELAGSYNTIHFLSIAILLLMTYCGLVVG